MTDKELKRLSRAELLAMLLEQVKENEKLKTRLAEMQAQLEDRQIMIDEAGSIAEAALRLNGVFQAAEAAAGQYLANIRRLCGEEESSGQSAKATEKAEAVPGGAAADNGQTSPETDQRQSEAEKKTQDPQKKQGGTRSTRRSRKRGRKKK